MDGEKKTLYDGKFERGLFSYEDLVMDKFYKRILVEAILSYEFDVPLGRNLSFNDKLKTA